MKTVIRYVMMMATACLVVLSSFQITSEKTYAAEGVELFTAYHELTSSPGESLSYSIDVINNSSTTKVVGLDVINNENWNYEMTVGGKLVQQLAIKPNSSSTVNLRVDVPLQIEKGKYRFSVKADEDILDLHINVAEKGTFQSNFVIEQHNQEGYAGNTFTFTTTLKNQTAKEQTYSLAANAPAGWEVRFKAGANYVSSVSLDINASQSITIEVKAPENLEATSYAIPVAAYNNETTAESELSIQIKGTYDLTLSTKDGRLNTDIKAGGNKTLELYVTNTGSSSLENVTLSSTAPTNWEVTFEPKTIDRLEAGEIATVQAVIKASEQALPGDYVSTISAKTAQKSDNAQLRITVKTSVLWGWIGVAIIACVIGIIYFLFHKYGRR